jgi:hypothetical protein
MFRARGLRRDASSENDAGRPVEFAKIQLHRSAMPYQVFKRNIPDENGHSRIVIDEHDTLPPGWEDAKFLLSEADLPSELRMAVETKGFFTYPDRRFVDETPCADVYCQNARKTRHS